MFTFQILDGGETFFFPLAGDALLVGSGESVQIRLREQGVSPVHARVVPAEGGYEIEAVDGPVLVNGTPGRRVRLNLGDRIELGKAVLVLGKRVRRPATPKDVVDQESVRPSLGRRPLRKSRRGLGVVLLGLVLAGGLGVFMFSQPRPSIAPPVVGELHQLRKSGEFGRAKQMIADLRTGAFSDDPVLLAEAGALEATEKEFQDLRAKTLREAASVSRADQTLALREMRAKSAREAQREAAGIVLAQLLDLREEAARAGRGPDSQPTPLDPQPKRPEQGREEVRPEALTKLPPAKDAAVPSTAATGVLTEVDRLAGQGSFAQALEVLMQGLATLPSDEAGPLRARLAPLQGTTRTAMEALLGEARALTSKGENQRALTLLRERAWQFPGQGELARVAEQIGFLERDLEQHSAAVASARAGGQRSDVGALHDGDLRRRTLESLKDDLAAAGVAERDGDLATARKMLEDCAARVRSTDLAFAVELDARVSDCGLLAELYALPVAASKERPVTVNLDGVVVPILRTKGDRLFLQTEGGERELRWSELPPAAWKPLLLAVGAPARAFVACGLLAFRATARDVADELLIHAWEADAATHPTISALLQRERLDPVDPTGYELVAGKFVTKRELLAEKRAKKIEDKVARAVASLDAKQKERALEELLAEGPETLDALIIALKNQQSRLVDKIDKSEFKKSWEKLAVERQGLDKARTFALQLIFDEVQYFYPYNPPAVDAKKAAEYWPVQREVDARVAKLRETWTGSKTRLQVPSSVLDDTRRFQWVRRVLQELGESDSNADARVAWVASLPHDGKLDLQGFCKDEREREDRDLFARIDAFNKKLEKELSNEERAEFRLTNEYRRMFGLRPLALHLKVLVAAREHSTEMASLGYFSHFSPTEGKRTPFDRMKLAGYVHGASENIAAVDGAEGAHQAWLHSSGHHRNILTPTHTEFAVGCSGRYWTQNFGRSKEYLENPAFPSPPEDSNANPAKK